MKHSVTLIEKVMALLAVGYFQSEIADELSHQHTAAAVGVALSVLRGQRVLARVRRSPRSTGAGCQ